MSRRLLFVVSVLGGCGGNGGFVGVCVRANALLQFSFVAMNHNQMRKHRVYSFGLKL